MLENTIIIPDPAGALASELQTVTAPTADALQTRVRSLFASLAALPVADAFYLVSFDVSGAGDGGLWCCSFGLQDLDAPPTGGGVELADAFAWFVEGDGSVDEQAAQDPTQESGLRRVLRNKIVAEIAATPDAVSATLEDLKTGGCNAGRRFILGGVGTLQISP